MKKDVNEFHKKFGLDYEGPPRFLPHHLAVLKVKHLKEELNEYIIAVKEGSMEKQFDALIDLVYVAIGTADLHGFPWEEGWSEVHRANMSKERATKAEQSTRGSSFDIIKPANFVPPDLESILVRANERYENHLKQIGQK